MIEKNKAIHEYTGVAAWHAAGYTGKGTRVATAETLDPADWPGKLVHSLREDVRTSNHSAMTTGVLFEVAPDVEAREAWKAEEAAKPQPEQLPTLEERTAAIEAVLLAMMTKEENA